MDTKAAERAIDADTGGMSATQTQALKRLVADMVSPGRRGTDPIAAVLRSISDQAIIEGITDADIDAELAAYNAERRS